MNKILAVFMFVLAVIGTVVFAYMTHYVLGFRKTNLLEITGYLSKTVLKKQVFRGHPFTGKWHKYWTEYTYTYRANGKAYEVSGGAPGQHKDLPNKVTVCVQKNAPAYAYIPQFEKAPSLLIPVFLLVGCVLFYTTFALWFL